MNPRLQAALTGWHNWEVSLPSQPQLVAQLQGGRTNSSYLVEAGSDRYVVRLNASHGEQLGVNRHYEAKILKVVSNAGIAPPVHYCSPEEGVLVTAYIEGASPDIKHPETLSRIQQLMDRVHNLSVDLPAFDYRHHLLMYRKALGDVQAGASEPPAIADMIDTLQRASGQCLCHHDPSQGNFIDANGRLYLIDWEYAGMGAPEFDSAAVRAEWGMFCAVPDLSDTVAVAATQIYRYTCQLWNRLNQPE